MSIVMAINGTDFINNPWNTTFSPFVDLLGMGFYLIPLSFIAVALYMKTRNPAGVSVFIFVSGLLLSGGSIFANYPEMAVVYTVFTAMGFVGLVLSIFFNRN